MYTDYDMQRTKVRYGISNIINDAAKLVTNELSGHEDMKPEYKLKINKLIQALLEVEV